MLIMQARIINGGGILLARSMTSADTLIEVAEYSNTALRFHVKASTVTDKGESVGALLCLSLCE